MELPTPSLESTLCVLLAPVSFSSSPVPYCAKGESSIGADTGLGRVGSGAFCSVFLETFFNDFEMVSERTLTG